METRGRDMGSTALVHPDVTVRIRGVQLPMQAIREFRERAMVAQGADKIRVDPGGAGGPLLGVVVGGSAVGEKTDLHGLPRSLPEARIGITVAREIVRGVV